MADHTGIEWADATWNPIVGCTIVSPGCTHCYAMGQAARIERMQPGSHYAGTTRPSKAGAVWSGKLALAPEHILAQPLHWRRPRRIFVNSMGDLFHEDAPDAWIDRVFAIMALAPQHTFMVLTKRSARMRTYLSQAGAILRDRWARAFEPGTLPIAQHQIDAWLSISASTKHRALYGARLVPLPLPNVWLGVSTEDQRRAADRVPDLLATPAAIRFVSAEPLLGPINYRRIRIAPDHHMMLDALDGYAITDSIAGSGQERAKLDLVIAGGESGPKARPMHPDWARSLRDQCATAGTAFFFKQWGEHITAAWAPSHIPISHAFDDGYQMIRVGKRAAGRLLDGVEHNAMPEVRA